MEDLLLLIGFILMFFAILAVSSFIVWALLAVRVGFARLNNELVIYIKIKKVLI